MRRVISLLLIFVFLFSFAACNSKPQFEVEFGDWYDMERQYFDISDFHSFPNDVPVAVTDDAVIVRRPYVNREMGDSLFKLNFDGSYTEVSLERIKNKLQDKDSSYIYAITEFNNTLYAFLYQWGIDPTRALSYCIEINMDEQSLGEVVELTELNGLLASENGVPFSVVNYNDQLIFQFSSYTGEPVTIVKMNSDFSCERIDISEDFSSYNVDFCNNSFMIDESHLVFELSGNGPYEYFALNLTNNRLEHIDYSAIGLSLFEECELNVSYANNNYCKKDSYGVYRYDYSAREFQQIFNFDDCNVNRWEIQQQWLSIVYMDYDTYVFAGPIFGEGRFDVKYEIIRLTKSDVDLRAGKTILTAVNLESGISPNIAEAVYQFNASNPDYYVALFDDFSILNYGYSDYYRSERSNTKVEDKTNGCNRLSTDIAMSLLSGEGPDIFLNSYDYTMINNSNCLLDLTPYITGENGINPDEYFTPLFAGAFDGEAMYQLPITINMNCTFGRFIPTTENGLSFEDYATQVDTIANGFDYIAYVYYPVEAFDFLLNSISDEIIVDGVINLDIPDFYGIVDYCEDMVAPSEAIMINNNMNCMDNMSFGSYLMCTSIKGDNPIVLTGFPSATADVSPTIRYTSSAAIAASCEHPDGAWTFLKTLISYESQCKNSVADRVSFMDDPVNIAAFETCGLISVSDTNISNGIMESDLFITTDDATLDLMYEYEDILQHAEVSYSLDPAIIAIMNEEIQAYWAGDKGIDEVISIIEDRVQTILNERG